MLSQRTVVPPGFAELASDAELAGQLGTALFGALLRLCHLAEPAADVPGGWSTTTSADGLAAALGVSRKTAARWCADLVAAGLLARVDGKRLGRGLGATPTRYFITAIAGLTVPTLPPPRHTPGRFSPGNSSPGKSAQVIAYPVHGVRATQLVRNTAPDGPHPVVDVLLEGTQHTAPEPAVPSWLRDALHQLGYVGELPAAITRDVPAETLMRVIEAVRSRPGITSGPKYLNWLMRSGPAAMETFLAAGTTADSDPVEDLMTPEDYMRLGEQHPAWKARVLENAGAEAASRGAGLDLRAVLRAAITTSLNDDDLSEAR